MKIKYEGRSAIAVKEIKKNTLRICDKQCENCLYTKNKLVSDNRRDEILYQLEQVNDYFVCHKASIVNEKVMCRGYYERNKVKSWLIILGEALGLIRFVNVTEIMRNGINKLRQKRKKL